MEHSKITPARPLAIEGPATSRTGGTDPATSDAPPVAALRDTLDTNDTGIATRHDGWTRAKQATFLRELAATHCVARAARAAGMSRQSAYALRARLKGEPFDRAWTAALLNRFDALAEAAVDRAMNGVEVQHYYNGELVGTSRKFDERLTVALLAMRGGLPSQRGVSYANNPAARYDSDDFGALLERVEEGPESWAEEQSREEMALYEGEPEDADEGDGWAGG